MDVATSSPAAGSAAGPAANGVSSSPFSPIDPARVLDYLAVVLEAALGASRLELEAPGSLLSKARLSDTLQRCTRFANDAQVALYIQKDIAASPEIEDGAGEPSASSSLVPFDLTF